MKWVRNKRLRNTGGSRAIAKRTFVPEGKLYPRISLSLYKRESPPWDEEGIVVSCSEKRNPQAWWEDRPCPIALVGELGEMLQEIAT
jgi:hypothetical protein